jgi:hypothetical protein
VTYHPAYLLRSPSEKRKAWGDLKFVRAELARARAAAGGAAAAGAGAAGAGAPEAGAPEAGAPGFDLVGGLMASGPERN